MNIRDLSKDELVDLLEFLNEAQALDIEVIPTDRFQVTKDPAGDVFWEKCERFRPTLEASF